MHANRQQEGGCWQQPAAVHGDGVMSGLPANGFPDAEADEASRAYTIREMARAFQVSIRTLRFYEDRGLLHPRREGTSRRYDARDRLHLRMILKGKSLGLTLTEIGDILAGQGRSPSKLDLEMDLLPERITAQIEHLERQRSQIDEAIRILRGAQRGGLDIPSQATGHNDSSNN